MILRGKATNSRRRFRFIPKLRNVSFGSPLWLLIVIIVTPLDPITSKRYEANIVEANAANQAFQQFDGPGLGVSSKLTLKREPAPFSGASALRNLRGKCFKLVKTEYEWKLCPFQNVTQMEIGSRWNPYRGVLGVWSGWTVDILRNAFVSMAMTDGDDCGNHGPRKVDVIPTCGVNESISSVEEPATCHYKMRLNSPIFCRRKRLSLYPNLEEEFKRKWDRVYSEWKNDLVTWRGYERSVLSLLASAGFLTEEVASKYPTGTNVNDNDNNNNNGGRGNVRNKEQNCQKKYELLLEKYEKLGKEHAETILELGKYQRGAPKLNNNDNT